MALSRTVFFFVHWGQGGRRKIQSPFHNSKTIKTMTMTLEIGRPKIIGTFRFDYEYEIEYECDFQI